MAIICLEVDATGFLRLMRQLMTGIVVRPRGGTHPRLSILGPLEARMLDADIIILGGLNEGIWPATPSPGRSCRAECAAI